MPMFVAPIAGALSDRIGGGRIMAHRARAAGDRARLDRRRVHGATVGYVSLVGPFVVSGIGMGLFFAPVANVVLSAVRPGEEGKASGAEQRDPRGRRRLRRRGAGVDLRALRRLRVRARRSTTGSSPRSGSARPSSVREQCSRSSSRASAASLRPSASESSSHSPSWNSAGVGPCRPTPGWRRRIPLVPSPREARGSSGA